MENRVKKESQNLDLLVIKDTPKYKGNITLIYLGIDSNKFDALVAYRERINLSTWLF